MATTLMRRFIVWPLAAVIFIASGFLAAQYLRPVQNPIPSDVKNRLNFTPLVVPNDTKTIATANYALGPKDESGYPLRFDAVINEKKIVITETSLPPQFNEIPDYKDRFIETFIQDSQTLSTASGALVYGTPAKDKTYKQVGLMLDHGLLTILTAQGAPLSRDELRQIGDALVAAR